MRTLDHLLSAFVSRPLDRLDPPVPGGAAARACSRSLFLGGVTDYAAVNESVELAKRESKGGAQLVNAVLRRAGREGAAATAPSSTTARPQRAAVLYSVPDWLAEMWWQ